MITLIETNNIINRARLMMALEKSSKPCIYFKNNEFHILANENISHSKEVVIHHKELCEIITTMMAGLNAEKIIALDECHKKLINHTRSL